MEDLVPILASSLVKLRRAPGNNVGWVDDILRKFERDRPADYHQTRRVHGLALRLADLARLTERETATLSLGLLFSGLVPKSTDERSEDCHPWMEYLWNEPWVEPCLKVAAAVRQPGSEETIGSMVALIATAARSLDAAAVLHTSSTLAVLKSLRAQARTADMERLVQLLWSEEGQAICDIHARQGGHPYVLNAAEIKHHIDVLRAAHVRTPTTHAPAGQKAHPDGAPAPVTAGATSSAFERRRRRLAVSGSLREVFATSGSGGAGAASPLPAAPEELAPESATAPGPPGHATAGDEQGHSHKPYGRTSTDLSEDTALSFGEDGEPEKAPPDGRHGVKTEPSPPAGAPAPAREDETMTISGESPTRGDGSGESALLAKLEELQTRLLEIERLAAEAEELLAGLRPSVEDFTAMLSQFESMLSRWKSPINSGRRAA